MDEEVTGYPDAAPTSPSGVPPRPVSRSDI